MFGCRFLMVTGFSSGSAVSVSAIDAQIAHCRPSHQPIRGVKSPESNPQANGILWSQRPKKPADSCAWQRLAALLHASYCAARHVVYLSLNM